LSDKESAAYARPVIFNRWSVFFLSISFGMPYKEPKYIIRTCNNEIIELKNPELSSEKDWRLLYDRLIILKRVKDKSVIDLYSIYGELLPYKNIISIRIAYNSDILVVYENLTSAILDGKTFTKKHNNIYSSISFINGVFNAYLIYIVVNGIKLHGILGCDGNELIPCTLYRVEVSEDCVKKVSDIITVYSSNKNTVDYITKDLLFYGSPFDYFESIYSNSDNYDPLLALKDGDIYRLNKRDLRIMGCTTLANKYKESLELAGYKKLSKPIKNTDQNPYWWNRLTN